MRAIALLLLGGCGSILGVHDFTTGDGDGGHGGDGTGGPAIVVEPHRVFTHRVGPAMASEVIPFTPNDKVAIAVAIDGVPIDPPPAIAADGTFTFAIAAGQHYTATIDGFGVAGVATGAPQREVVPIHLDRSPGEPLASPNTSIQLGSVSGPTPNYMFVDGEMVYTTVTANTVPTVVLDGAFETGPSESQIPALAAHVLPRVANGDRLSFAHLVLSGSIGHFDYVGLASADVVDGGVTTVDVAMASVPTNQCFITTTTLDNENARLTATVGNASLYTASSRFVGVRGEPDTTHTAGVTIAIDTAASDHALQLPFGNQAGSDYAEIAVETTSLSRTDLVGASDSIRYVVAFPPSGGDCAHAAVVSWPEPIEIPTLATLGHTPLDVDEQSIAISVSSPPTLAWSTTGGAAPPDAYEVTILDANNSTAMPTASLLTTEQQLVLDPSVFIDNGEYVIRVQAIIGMPNAASGDYDTTALPAARSATTSSRFIATPAD